MMTAIKVWSVDGKRWLQFENQDGVGVRLRADSLLFLTQRTDKTPEGQVVPGAFIVFAPSNGFNTPANLETVFKALKCEMPNPGEFVEVEVVEIKPSSALKLADTAGEGAAT